LRANFVSGSEQYLTAKSAGGVGLDDEICETKVEQFEEARTTKRTTAEH